MVSDENGKFTVKTIMPGSYPNSQNPRHVHFVIERNGKEQFSELVFEGDPYVTDELKTIPAFVVSPLLDEAGCKASHFEIILEK